MSSTIISTRKWYILIGLGSIIMIAGFTMFVYGLQTMPNELPKELVPVYNSQNPNAYSLALTQYQIQSFSFKILMSGVGMCVFVLACLGIISCVYEVQATQILPQ